MKIKSLNKKELRKSWRKLKKSTRNFSANIARDPLDYLDFEVNLKENINSIINEVNTSDYQPYKPYLHFSPKGKGIDRQTLTFDVRDALIYRFCIEQIDDDLIKKVKNKGIYGGIKISPTQNVANPEEFYEKWFKKWEELQKYLEQERNEGNCIAVTDIASYFENINLLLLKDMVRSEAFGKSKILDLLFYFLEQVCFRNDYAVNTFNGLPQDNIDCSGILAHFYLYSHDQAMRTFCRKNNSNFYRWMDDMSIAVKDETTARKALKELTSSLRRLGLMASVEKTLILKNDEINGHFFFGENNILNKYQDEIIDSIQKNDEAKIEKLKLELEKNIKKFYKKEGSGNWTKVLKRYYSLFTYVKSNILFGQIIDHLIKYPFLTVEGKTRKYLIANQEQKRFDHCIEKIIDYLYSAENLYPAVESEILETFLCFDEDKLSRKIKERFKTLSTDIFFKKNGYNPQSEYTRALSCLLSFRFNNEMIDALAKHYVKFNEGDYLLKKYIIFCSLTTNNQNLRDRILMKARKEQNFSIHRLVNLIENVDTYKKSKVITNYCKKNKIYILVKDGKGILVKDYKSVRVDVLNKLIEIYSK